MNDDIEFTDRYAGNYPNTETMCRGQCEGLGQYPVSLNDLNKEACNNGGKLIINGQRDKNGKPYKNDDGYVFVQCPDCKGTGLKE